MGAYLYSTHSWLITHHVSSDKERGARHFNIRRNPPDCNHQKIMRVVGATVHFHNKIEQFYYEEIKLLFPNAR